MKASSGLLIEEIKALSKPVKGIAHLLNSASGSATVGTIISQAFEKVGENGSTVVEESQTLSDEVGFTEGLNIDRGYLSPYFVNDNERHVCEMSKPTTSDRQED
jgi:chaperonin GroEL